MGLSLTPTESWLLCWIIIGFHFLPPHCFIFPFFIFLFIFLLLSLVFSFSLFSVYLFYLDLFISSDLSFFSSLFQFDVWIWISTSHICFVFFRFPTFILPSSLVFIFNLYLLFRLYFTSLPYFTLPPILQFLRLMFFIRYLFLLLLFPSFIVSLACSLIPQPIKKKTPFFLFHSLLPFSSLSFPSPPLSRRLPVP